MKTIRIKIYKFDELSKEAQSNAINKMRDINVNDDFWFDYILEDFKIQLENLGFRDAQIQFSGFWSQGDGLSFDAKINVSKFAETTNEKRVANLHNAGFLDQFYISKTSYSSHYCHERTRFVDYDITNYENINNVLEKLCEKIEAKRLELCKDFYSQLNNLYDELQNDEAVKETILANEYDFLKDGTQY